MDIKQEIVDAITMIVDSTIKKTCPIITFGLCVGISNRNKCVVKINNIDYNLSYYGEALPIINKKYPVFVPYNNMSMAFILTSGSSDGRLNMKIVGSITTPTNPTENTIWVKTNEPIAKWSFNANNRPSSDTNGALNILYAASTELVARNANFAVYNGIQDGIQGQFWVKLIGCTQTINGLNQYVNAYIYQGGNWVQFSQDNLVLIRNNVLDARYTAMVGGVSTATIEMTSEGLHLYAPAASGTYCVGYLAPKINIDDYSKIIIKWKGHGYGSSVRVGLIDNPITNGGSEQQFIISANVARESNIYSDVQNTTLDISNLTGDHYFAVATAGSGASGYTGEILASEVIFER